MKIMGGGGAQAFFAVAALIWAGCDSDAPSASLDASGSAGASGSSDEGDAGLVDSGGDGSGRGGNVATTRGPGDFDSCNSVARVAPADAGDAPGARPSRLGLLVSEPITVDGQVSDLAADRMVITTPEDTLTFFWMGPSLDAAFTIGDAVQVVAEDTNLGAFGAQWLSSVRSGDATAAVLDAIPMTVMGKSPGSTRSLALSPSFPELVYGVKSCCFTATGTSSNPYYYSCDYSLLDATFEGTSVPVALGATGLLGPWSVTNIRSRYTEQIESTWSLAVSLLGPATPRAVDAGR